MVIFRITAMLMYINWSAAITAVNQLSIQFTQPRQSQLPAGGVMQIAGFRTDSVIGCARRCWESLDSDRCTSIMYQPDSCEENNGKPTRSGVCRLLQISGTVPMTFGPANSSCLQFYSLPLANCSIVAQSFGYAGGIGACSGSTLYTQFGYVSLNGKMLFNMSVCDNIPTTNGSQLGVVLLTLDPLSCTILTSKAYNTFTRQEDSKSLANALVNAPNGTLFVAVTADEPQHEISPAVSRLMSACNVNLTSLQFRGSFAFVCVAGYPAKTKWQIQPAQSPGAYVAVTVSGTQIGASLSIIGV